jgi:hypothetical protein
VIGWSLAGGSEALVECTLVDVVGHCSSVRVRLCAAATCACSLAADCRRCMLWTCPLCRWRMLLSMLNGWAWPTASLLSRQARVLSGLGAGLMAGGQRHRSSGCLQ